MPFDISTLRGPQEVGAYPGELKAPFPKRQLILNAFDMLSPAHVVTGTWVGEKPGPKFDTIEYWQNQAKLLERGRFHGIFIADSYGTYDVYEGSISASLKGGFQIPKLDPLLIVTAMAAVTESLSFGITSTTTYEAPYALARRFTTLDHFTNGRVGWNIVTSHLASAARNFGFKEAVEHDKRYEIADEFMDVVYKLWESSWHDNAVKRDQEKGIWTEPALVRPINHSSPHFPDIPGPFISHPSPQRTPVLYQAGSSGAGTTFGAKHAEAVFIAQPNPKLAGLKVAEYRAKVAEFGRDPRLLKVIPGLLIFLGKTEKEAEDNYQYWKAKGDGEAALAFNAASTGTDWAQFGEDEELILPPGSGGHAFLENQKRVAPHITKWTRAVLRDHLVLARFGATVVGTPAQVADIIEEWVEVGDVDGFNLSHFSRSQSFEDIVELLIPELQRRGIFRNEYPEMPQPKGATQKKHLHHTHYGYSHKWLETEEEAKAKWEAAKLAKGAAVF
ncbi:luciferase-like domain-containing protein [Leucosporidium creatinivorum]|uniref:Luciferase-like domain-containing protein n=1 Tax=Leucosporidium creatinivorum TaxID=106004 RepID=A0A1Y2EME6_9BASI|nr:luciferase-like domain-containing protein [Leucosporidium creatinivorum]